MSINKQKTISLILACNINGGIGYDKQIPWYVPGELQKFKEITSEVQVSGKVNAVVMGRNTWESLPKRPLQNRLNIVLTSDTKYKVPYKNVVVLHNIFDVMLYCNRTEYIEKIFIIGGADLYNQVLFSDFYRNKIDKIYLTVMFYNASQYKTNKFINIEHIFNTFDVQKHEKYKEQADNRIFASYICIPKMHYKSTWHKKLSM
jgi:dihydrofolate reductase